MYCAAPATSIDHVIPRSRGGAHNWENVVSACHRCNHTKADKPLKDLGWRLRTLPREPVGAAWRILGTGRTDKTWLPYLEPSVIRLELPPSDIESAFVYHWILPVVSRFKSVSCSYEI